MKSTMINACSAVTLGCVLFPIFAVAEDEENKSIFTFEEIVVTATRRAVSLQDVSQSITALTDQKLKSMGAFNLEDYALTVPGVQIVKGAPGSNNVSIRGIRSIEGSTGAAVGYYLDETPLSAAFSFPEIPTLDIERVEILRGPQGTLYGEGSMGGTIRVITKKPNVEDFELEVGGALSTTRFGGENYRANIVANMPIIQDKLAVRVVGSFDDISGFIDNVHLGTENVNHSESYHLRVAGRLLVNEALTIDATANISRTDFGNVNRGTPDLKVARSIDESGSDDYELYNLTVQYAFPGADLVSSSSYYKRDNFSQADRAEQIGTINFLFGLVGLGPFDSASQDEPNETEMFAQEVRLVSTSDGPFQWTVGGFYKNLDKSTNIDGVTSPGLSPEELAFTNEIFFGLSGIDQIFHGEEQFSLKQIAGFGEASYDVTDRLNILSGIRVFQEKRKSETFNTGTFFLALTGLPPTTGSSDNTDTVVTPKVTVTYDYSDDGLIYATVSKGFRSGGENQDATFVSPLETSYDPETLWNYELGFKSVLADGMATFNAAVYYMKWNDMQVVTTTADIGIVIGNAGSAHSLGVDAELVVYPADGLQITLGGAWIEAKTDEPVSLPNVAPTPDDIAPKDTRIPGVPELTLNAAVDYRFPLANGLTGLLHADYLHYGSTFSSLGHAAGFNNPVLLPSYDTLNLRIAVEAEQWSLALFAKNLTDERQLTTFGNSDVLGAGLGNFFAVGRPRTFGISVNFKL